MSNDSEVTQLVNFWLGSEEFGVNISQVKEIIKIEEITKIPNTPDFMEGVINLRGQITPVMDLRSRLGIEAAQESENSRMIIVEIGKDNVGMIVDSVTEVCSISSGDIEPSTSFTGNVDTEYILGVGKVGDRLLILLDLSKVISGTELEQQKEMAGITA
ncbi:MAG: chemotaxis protein CheW [Candidatus Hydrothermarchaeaceae archaeon]